MFYTYYYNINHKICIWQSKFLKDRIFKKIKINFLPWELCFFHSRDSNIVSNEKSMLCCSWLHLPTSPVRTVTSYGLGQECRKVSHVSRVLVKQTLVGRGCTENKRAAILSGLTTRPLSEHSAPSFPRGILVTLILDFLLYVLSEPG